MDLGSLVCVLSTPSVPKCGIIAMDFCDLHRHFLSRPGFAGDHSGDSTQNKAIMSTLAPFLATFRATLDGRNLVERASHKLRPVVYRGMIPKSLRRFGNILQQERPELISSSNILFR
jgi:hypothetical protein